MIKKLRYYARFTIVCLLLNHRDIISTLKKELDELVKEYIATYKPTDANDWELVVREISDFANVRSYMSLRREQHRVTDAFTN